MSILGFFARGFYAPLDESSTEKVENNSVWQNRLAVLKRPMAKLVLSVVFLIIITIAGFLGMFGDFSSNPTPEPKTTPVATFDDVQPTQESTGMFTPGSSVRTTSGVVYGHRAPNASQVSEYLGIPFAMPPLGQLRFAPPVAYTSTGNIEASSFSHICPTTRQRVPGILATNVYQILSHLGHTDDDPQEDCLYLNVWSKPQVGEPSKPVLVYFHGGGFHTGGASTAAYSGQFFADTEDVVVVNFNYRSNVFGFPGAPGLVQNVGLLDQRMAVEWVRDNIAGFGGDPAKIVIFGHSAGGASVDFYNYAWTKDPIISGSIAMSGTAISFGNKSPDQAAKAWNTLTEKLGCGTTTIASQEEVIACMRRESITMEDIIAAQRQTDLGRILPDFGPTIDETTIFSNYNDLALSERFIHKPYVTGSAFYESGIFAQVALGSGTTQPESVWDKFNLNVFTCPGSHAANVRARSSIPTWRYRYFGMFPNLQLPTSIDKAWHGSEIMPMFGSSEEITLEDSTWEERALGSWLRGAWAEFARDPEQGLTAYGWGMYDIETETMALLGRQNQSQIAFDRAESWDTGCAGVSA